MPRSAMLSAAFTCAFLSAAILSACSGSSSSAPQQTGAMLPATTDRNVQLAVSSGFTTWNVQAGASTTDYAIQDLDFYPKTITINAGDNITWRVAASEPHTVTFLAPGQTPPPGSSPQAVVPAGGTYYNGTSFINSGILNGGYKFTVKFLKPGTYTYYCLFHQPAMEGTVIVQKAGTPYPHTAQYYLTIGAQDEWEDLGAAQLSVSSFPFADRGTTFAAGIDPGLVTFPPPDSTVLRFINTNNRGLLATAGNKTIKVGTTLTWVNETSNEVHTVTFPAAGKPLPEMNPFSPPSGGTVYDGTHLVNSGILPPKGRFSLTFTKTGTFTYFCLLHDNSGMMGTITVTQ